MKWKKNIVIMLFACGTFSSYADSDLDRYIGSFEVVGLKCILGFAPEYLDVVDPCLFKNYKQVEVSVSGDHLKLEDPTSSQTSPLFIPRWDSNSTSSSSIYRTHVFSETDGPRRVFSSAVYNVVGDGLDDIYTGPTSKTLHSSFVFGDGQDINGKPIVGLQVLESTTADFAIWHWTLELTLRRVK